MADDYTYPGQDPVTTQSPDSMTWLEKLQDLAKDVDFQQGDPRSQPRGVLGQAWPTQDAWGDLGMKATMWTDDPATRRHEYLGHSTLGRAIQTGRTKDLDPAGQFTAYLLGTYNPVTQGLGMTLDEARSYGLEKAIPAYLQSGSAGDAWKAGLGEGTSNFFFNPYRANRYASDYERWARNGDPFRRYDMAVHNPDDLRAAADILRITGGLGQIYRGGQQALGSIPNALGSVQNAFGTIPNAFGIGQ